jgi:hypothetical protein
VLLTFFECFGAGVVNSYTSRAATLDGGWIELLQFILEGGMDTSDGQSYLVSTQALSSSISPTSLPSESEPSFSSTSSSSVSSFSSSSSLSVWWWERLRCSRFEVGSSVCS